MFGAIFIDASQVFSIGMLLFAAAVGGWLVIQPQQLFKQFGIPDEDEWGKLIIQIIGQILLGISVIPIIFKINQWLFLQ